MLTSDTSSTREPSSSESELRDKIDGLQRQLAQAQRMATLGELVSTTTHEFNNILMSIINYARLAMRQRDDEARQKSLRRILDAGQRAAKITNSILGVARNRGEQLEPINLRALVEDALVVVERELRKYRINVTQELAEVPATLAHGNQLQQVLLNLLINARQAMPEGGEILIRLDHDEAAKINELTIRDTGCGIPADKLTRIFDPFFTTKNGPDASGKGGTGLGLAACRDIIEAHKGRIRVASTVGKGTAFILKLPAA